MLTSMSPISISSQDCFYTANGRLVFDLSQVPKNVPVQTHYRLRGGKGGFGSMLRAIGSQIEKTTNHEMCRDLSGRRMRDVNMERKLKEWYAKASEREREKMEKYYERRRKRQEMLAQGPLPGHKFSDREYERQKRKIAYELQGALDTAIAQIIGEKSSGSGPSTSGPSEPKRTKLWIERLDGETSSSSSSSSDASETEDGAERTSSVAGVTSSLEEQECSESTSDIPSESVPIPQPIDITTTSVQQPDVPNSQPAPSPQPATAEQPGSTHKTEPLTKTSVIPLTDLELNQAPDAQSLEAHGLEVLKESLTIRGLKCGGTIQERAARLFSIRGLQPEEYPFKLRVKQK